MNVDTKDSSSRSLLIRICRAKSNIRYFPSTSRHNRRPRTMCHRCRSHFNLMTSLSGQIQLAITASRITISLIYFAIPWRYGRHHSHCRTGACGCGPERRRDVSTELASRYTHSFAHLGTHISSDEPCRTMKKALKYIMIFMASQSRE